MTANTSIKRAILRAGIINIVALSSFALSSSATAAIINGGFEDNPAFDGWTTKGDVSHQSTFDGLRPTGSFQAMLTTAAALREDDENSSYNFSGIDPADENFNNELETFLGLAPDSLDDPLESPFGATEGSAMLQTFTAQEGETLSFRWNLLTNDGEDPDFGSFRDYAFVTLYQVNSSASLSVLASSSSFLLSSSNTRFSQETGYKKFTSSALTAGDYVLGIGVVDGAGTDTTSALLVDDVRLSSTSVPEPSSIVGLFGLGTLGASFRLRRKQLSK